MKKILLLLLLLFGLTGCGVKKGCDFTFNGDMTKDYSKDALNCSVVTYVDKKNNFEIITTPTADDKYFTAKLNYNGRELWYSFSDIQFINTKIRKYNDKNTTFVELYTDKKMANIYLLVFDNWGNLKFELTSTSSPVVDGDTVILREYLRKSDTGEFLCKDYNLESPVYREVTYNIFNFEIIGSKEF